MPLVKLSSRRMLPMSLSSIGSSAETFEAFAKRYVGWFGMMFLCVKELASRWN